MKNEILVKCFAPVGFGAWAFDGEFVGVSVSAIMRENSIPAGYSLEIYKNVKIGQTTKQIRVDTLLV